MPTIAFYITYKKSEQCEHIKILVILIMLEMLPHLKLAVNITTLYHKVRH